MNCSGCLIGTNFICIVSQSPFGCWATSVRVPTGSSKDGFLTANGFFVRKVGVWAVANAY